MHLTKVNGGENWLDGTRYEDTEVSSVTKLIVDETAIYYRYSNGRFLDRVPSYHYHGLCQINISYIFN